MLELTHGDDETLHCQVMDPITELPVSLTGIVEITFMVKRSVRDLDVDALLTKTLTTGITVTDEPDGKFDVVLTNAETETLPVGVLVYGIQLRDGAGKTNEKHRGQLRVTQDVVRA